MRVMELGHETRADPDDFEVARKPGVAEPQDELDEKKSGRDAGRRRREPRPPIAELHLSRRPR
jgi:hypothetical protein